ncbi:MAG: NAD(P)H-dependent oxidoreductase subunit E [Armatimonadota bacterium]
MSERETLKTRADACAHCTSSERLEDDDLDHIDGLVEQIGRGREAVIPLLHAVQQHFRYLPDAALQRICEQTEITPADIIGASTFYEKFRHEPVGEHLISVCHGTACHVKGAQQISDALRRDLDIDEGCTTTDDELFTLQRVHCVGCCTLAPVVQIDGVTYGHLTPDGVPQMLDDFLTLAARGSLQPSIPSEASAANGIAEIRVSVASCCIASGTMDVFEKMQEVVRDFQAPAIVKPVGCVGMCHQVPMVEVAVPGEPPAVYAKVRPSDAEAIVRRHFTAQGVNRRLRLEVRHALDRLLTNEAWEPVERHELSTENGAARAFLQPQKHLATEQYGTSNPTDLEEYVEHDGFEALRRCVTEMSPEQVIEMVDRAGLRGRGGAGFPTGRKWRLVREADDEVKYVICNGDEGDPGAFMDRMLMESYPFRILEGIAIAAYATGAEEALIYVRAEYAMAVKPLWDAIQRCEEVGLLGDNIFDTDFSLQVGLTEGAGAFVCGEETALIASIEGRRGTPHLRPPYPAEKGLYGHPTCVNNVETLALVPCIIRDGASRFAALGTADSKGTKVFPLAGKVRRGGLIEVEMGTTIREVVEDIGGGMMEGRQFKAVQVGGPSGGCIPASLSDTPIDFEAINESGAIMGSGGLVVLDDTDCMLDVARYFLEFTQRESCGKCTPCRIGTRRMLDILNRLCTGQGRPGDIDELEELGMMVKQASLCGLGKTAPNPVLTTIRYFREEYEAHVEGRCPAGKCPDLIKYVITDDCIGCTKCAQKCPTDAIEMRPYEKHEIDTEKCVRCDTCRQICPSDAIIIE